MSHPEIDVPPEIIYNELGEGFANTGLDSIDLSLGNRLQVVKFYGTKEDEQKEDKKFEKWKTDRRRRRKKRIKSTAKEFGVDLRDWEGVDEDWDDVNNKEEKEEEREAEKRRMKLKEGITCYAVYAAGAIGHELHAVHIDQKKLAATGDVRKVMMQTEILQVERSHFFHREACLVACRTSGSLGLFRLMEQDFLPGSASIEKIGETVWSSVCKERRAIGVDMALSPYDASDALVVSNKGTLHHFDVLWRGISLDHLCETQQSVFDDCTDGNRFWNVKWGTRKHDALMSGDKTLARVDLRSRDFSALFSLGPDRRIREAVTSFDFVDVNTICLATTNRVCWIDIRFPKEPAVTYEHGRVYDRTLSVNPVRIGDGSRVLLSSNSAPAISIYDVRRSTEHSRRGYYRAYGSPSYLPGAFSSLSHTVHRSGIAYAPRVGHFGDIFDDSTVDLLELSVDGELAVRSLSLKQEGQQFEPTYRNRYVALSKPVPDREVKKIVDFRKFYRWLFMQDVCRDEVDLDTERIQTIIRKMPGVWYNGEWSLDAPITLLDAAFRSRERDNVNSGSSFWSGSGLRYDSYMGEPSSRVPEYIKGGASWSYEVSPLIRKLDPEMSLLSSHATLDHLIPYTSVRHLTTTDGELDHVGVLKRRDMAACKQLALDLTFSESIYSFNRPFASYLNDPSSQLPDGSHGLTLAAQSMLLCDGEPPDIDFGYLKPQFSSDEILNDDEAMGDVSSPHRHRKSKNFTHPLGARLILLEWQPDTTVDSYVFKDPYDTASGYWRRYIPGMHQSAASKEPTFRGLRSLSHPKSRSRSLPPSRAPTVASSRMSKASQPPTVASSQPVSMASQPRPIASSRAASTVSQAPSARSRAVSLTSLNQTPISTPRPESLGPSAGSSPPGTPVTIASSQPIPTAHQLHLTPRTNLGDYQLDYPTSEPNDIDSRLTPGLQSMVRRSSSRPVDGAPPKKKPKRVEGF
ncbi:uncharacterized protein EI90DRAFT_3027719 [Cantharellus anzutake]|uniref:uncharacterized protein n=1 Tax=Cantharellus anzutake TaxID=1750568 RepID=UPI0019065A63|nr:uncharacterized protein EI90DRAFT_3027719 [Cantharellus anzutake]KAF8343974.1 hypothetical protein EI90DRAFT_3027719 [Cantharellus anzutake]